MTHKHPWRTCRACRDGRITSLSVQRVLADGVERSAVDVAVEILGGCTTGAQVQHALGILRALEAAGIVVRHQRPGRVTFEVVRRSE